MADQPREAAEAITDPNATVTNDGRPNAFLVTHTQRAGTVDCTVLDDGRVHARFSDQTHDGYVFADAADTNTAVQSWAAGRSPARDVTHLPAPPSTVR